MKAGLFLLILGIFMVLYFYVTYRKSSKSLEDIKNEDLVSYYLDLALHLVPIPFRIGVIGIVLILIAIIVILVNIPWTF